MPDSGASVGRVGGGLRIREVSLLPPRIRVANAKCRCPTPGLAAGGREAGTRAERYLFSPLGAELLMPSAGARLRGRRREGERRAYPSFPSLPHGKSPKLLCVRNSPCTVDDEIFVLLKPQRARPELGDFCVGEHRRGARDGAPLGVACVAHGEIVLSQPSLASDDEKLVSETIPFSLNLGFGR